jgi:hypothetical protein
MFVSGSRLAVAFESGAADCLGISWGNTNERRILIVALAPHRQNVKERLASCRTTRKTDSHTLVSTTAPITYLGTTSAPFLAALGRDPAINVCRGQLFEATNRRAEWEDLLVQLRRASGE